MIRLHLSNGTTDVDTDRLAGAFSIRREELEVRLHLGTIRYWFELGPGDAATPRTVFCSTETAQRVNLDRNGWIMPPEEALAADRSVPCSETCQVGFATFGTEDAVAPPDDASRTRGLAPRSAGAGNFDDLLDEALRATFPASDPIAIGFNQIQALPRERKTWA